MTRTRQPKTCLCGQVFTPAYRAQPCPVCEVTVTPPYTPPVRQRRELRFVMPRLKPRAEYVASRRIPRPTYDAIALEAWLLSKGGGYD